MENPTLSQHDKLKKQYGNVFVYNLIKNDRKGLSLMAEYCGLDLGPMFDRRPVEFLDIPHAKSPDQCLKELRGLIDSRPDLDGMMFPYVLRFTFLIS